LTVNSVSKSSPVRIPTPIARGPAGESAAIPPVQDATTCYALRELASISEEDNSYDDNVIHRQKHKTGQDRQLIRMLCSPVGVRVGPGLCS
jgi:hypothetical protein